MKSIPTLSAIVKFFKSVACERHNKQCCLGGLYSGHALAFGMSLELFKLDFTAEINVLLDEKVQLSAVAFQFKPEISI